MNEEQLIKAINLAASQGKADVVMELTQVLRSMGQRAPAEPEYRATDDMSGTEKFMAGMGRAVVGTGQGIKQLYNHAAPWVSDEDAADYDKKVADESRLYEQDLGQTGAGIAGNIAGHGAMAVLPGGAITKAVQGGRAGMGAMMAANAASGAALGASQPVTNGGGGYWADKAAQTATGAATGAAATGAMEAVRRGLPAIANAPGNLYNRMVTKSAARAEQAARQSGSTTVAQSAQRLGVNSLPKGAESGSKTGIMAENMARQSIFSTEKALEADQRVAGQVIQSIRNLMARITPASTDVDGIAASVRRTVNTSINNLYSQRERLSAPLWRRLEQMGVRAVPMQRTAQVLKQHLVEYQGVVGAEGKAIRNGLGKLYDEIAKTDDGAMTLRALVANRRELSRATVGKSNLLGSKVSPANQARIARDVLKAMEDDLAGASDLLGGDAGGILAAANRIWKEYTSAADAIARTPLGKLLGEDVAETLATKAFNEQGSRVVVERLMKLEPAQMREAVRMLGEVDPQAVNAVRRHFIQEALDAGMAVPPSAGQNVVGLSASKFINRLGYDRQSMERMKALFTPQQLQDIMDVRRVLRAWGDRSGFNFSGTGPYNEAVGVMGALGSTKGAIIGMLGKATGLQRVAAAMADPNGARLAANLLNAPERVWRFNLPQLEQRLAELLAMGAVHSVDQQAQQPAQGQPGPYQQ